MPNQVTRSCDRVPDWSPTEVDGDGGICNGTFAFPKKRLSDMSDEEREALYEDFVRHVRTTGGDIVELSPTRVIENPSPRAARKKPPVRQPGIVVDGEDYDVLAPIVGEEEARRLCRGSLSRPVSDAEAERAEEFNLTTAERNAKARFGSI